MFIIHQNYSLKPYNTFGVEVCAKFFIHATNLYELRSPLHSIQEQAQPPLVLGGGSNILFTQDYDGLVIRNEIKGIEVIKEDKTFVWVKVGGGEVWHDLVQHCVQHNWGGIENLSLIPGSVGAAPVQNIGAYGVELKDVFECLEAIELSTGRLHNFTKTACAFGYRDSIFKRSLKGKFAIVSVTLKLRKQPIFNISYGAIQRELDQRYPNEPLTIARISAIICAIRTNKLPDPAVIGNCGSFFKNPVIDKKQFENLCQQYPNMPHYVLSDDAIKIPAAWLIEQCGWKGKVVGNTGTYNNHALVLVNHGGASGQEVKALAGQIQSSVNEKFNIEIEREVNVL